MQFLVLAKGAKGAACVALIQQVLSNKKLFVFGELLAMPNVQAVRFSVYNTTNENFIALAGGCYQLQETGRRLVRLASAVLERQAAKSPCN